MQDMYGSELFPDKETEKEFDAILNAVQNEIEADERNVTILNALRMKQFQFAYACLRYITQEDETISVTYKLCEPFKTMGSVTVEGEESLEFYNSKYLARAIEFASNVEVYPLANGCVRMTLTFHGLTKPIE